MLRHTERLQVCGNLIQKIIDTAVKSSIIKRVKAKYTMNNHKQQYKKINPPRGKLFLLPEIVCLADRTEGDFLFKEM